MSRPDSGGGGSTGPFEHYDVSEGSVWGAGDSVRSYAGDVEALQGDVVGAHRKAQHGVAGLLEGPMVAAPQPVKNHASQWMQAALFGGGAIRLWGDAIQEYNKGIDDLNQRYQSAKASNFGLTPETLPANATSQERQTADTNFRTDVANADSALLAQLRREKDTRLVPALDDGAQKSAGLLDKGPSDDAAVLQLYQAGALPLVAPAAFPGVNFTHIDRTQLYNNLVRTGQLPSNLETMDENQLVQWFKDHPEDANMAALLLGAPTLNQGQTNVLRGLGRYDGWVTAQGMQKPPGRAGLDQLGVGTQRLSDINSRVAHGDQLTAGDRAYLNSWYNEMGADNLAQLPKYVSDAAYEDIPSGMPGYASQSMLEGAQRDYLSPVANGIMNLSNPDKGGVTGMEQMPQAVRDLANTPIGDIADGSGLRWGSVDEDGNPIERYENQGMPDERRIFQIDGLERWGGFSDLMTQSTVEGGDQFTRELGESALRVKQDLNAISANETDAMRAMGGPDSHYTSLKLATFDNNVSDMLSVVGRNEDAAAEMLNNETDRRTLLGMNWYDDQGATDVIRGGTDRDPADGGGTRAQAEAAMHVMQEVGGDRDAYLQRMSEGVEDAVVDTGINWMDTFARPGVNTPSAVGNYENALGDERLGIQLSSADRANFLQFVSGTEYLQPGDPGYDADHPNAHRDGDAVRFRGASVAYSRELVAEALQDGNSNTVDAALADAARLDGSITRADYEYVLDRSEDGHDARMAAYEAEKSRNFGYALASKVGVAAVTQGVNAASGGVAAPFTAIAGPALNAAVDQIFDAGDPPENQTPTTREQLFDRNRQDFIDRRNYFLLSAYDRAGIEIPPGETASDVSDIYQPNGQLRSYDELAGGSSDLLRHLASAQEAAQDKWQDDHPGESINVAENYDNVRNSIDNGSYWNEQPEREGGWTDENQSRVRLYGEHYVDDGDVDDLFEDRVPSDPNHYYDRDPG